MTTTISSAAASNSAQLDPALAHLGAPIADTPSASAADTYVATLAPSTPAAPGVLAAGTSTKKNRLKWRDLDKSLPLFKRVILFVKANLAPKTQNHV